MQTPGSENQPNPAKPALVVEVETAKCSACGFTEECTPAYIRKVRERYRGRWLCGLCIEAVKDEVLRSEELITIEEALYRHITFCQRFRKFIPDEDAERSITVNGITSRRSLDAPSTLLWNSATSSHRTDGLPAHPAPTSGLVRSETCFSFLSG